MIYPINEREIEKKIYGEVVTKRIGEQKERARLVEEVIAEIAKHPDREKLVIQAGTVWLPDERFKWCRSFTPEVGLVVQAILPF